MRNICIIFLLLLSIIVYADVYSVKVMYMAASSTLPDLSNKKAPYNERHVRYSVDKILDNDPSTAWSENKDGPGIGESISLVLKEQITVDTISFMCGYFEDGFYKKNNRIKTMTLKIEGFKDIHLEFKDKMEKQDFTFKTPIQLFSLEISIDSVYPGTEWDDTCLAELGFSYKNKDIAIMCPRINYRNNQYLLPEKEPLPLLIVTDEYPRASFTLHPDGHLTGDLGPGHQMGKSLENGTWEFDPKQGIFTLSYAYYDGVGKMMGMEEEDLPEPELTNDSAELLLLGINLSENMLNDPWDLHCAVIRFEDIFAH